MKKLIAVLVIIICSYSGAIAEDWRTPEAYRAFGKLGDTVRGSAPNATTSSETEVAPNTSTSTIKPKLKKKIAKKDNTNTSYTQQQKYVQSSDTVRVSPGYDESYISSLSDADKKQFNIAYNFLKGKATEFYRNEKGIQFYTVTDRTNSQIYVTEWVLLYKGEIMNSLNAYLCKEKKVVMLALTQFDLALYRKNHLENDTYKPGYLNYIQEMVCNKVCP